MKILFVNLQDVFGGGSTRACYRLLEALNNIGVETTMFVQKKTGNDPRVFSLGSKKDKGLAILKTHLDTMPLYFYPKRTSNFFSSNYVPSGTLIKTINSTDADLVHLHWIGSGMLRIEDIKKIKKPIVWTLHNMWPLTGGCIDGECSNYTKGCGNCPLLSSKKSNDLSRWIFNRKLSAYAEKPDITFVAVSRWLQQFASEANILKNHDVVHLPNLINSNVFSPVRKEVAREILNIKSPKKLILFGAINSTSNPNKGFDLFCKAINDLSTRNAEVLVFGARKPITPTIINFPVRYFGELFDDLSLKILYSAADVMVVPSRHETFGLTASEAMSCGTPVAAFRTTGLIDIVDHQQNGYLAEPFDPHDLAQGIDWLLNHDSYDGLCQNARLKILTCFESKKVSKLYASLYKKILTKEFSLSIEK